MAISKDFVVKNGLEIRGDTLRIGRAVLKDTGSGNLAVFESDGTTPSAFVEGNGLYYTASRADSDARNAVSAGTGLSYDATTGVFSVPASGVTAGTYGSASLVPIITVDAQGFVDSIGEVSVAGVSAFEYDSANGNLIISTADGGSFTQTITLSPFTTTNLAEGTNQYHTTARAREAVSATDAGGDGSFSYNNSTGVFTYTGPSAAETRAHFSAGTGVTLSSGQISIGQAVGTTDNVTFNNVTVNGSLSSDDLTAATVTTSGNVIVQGNLTVNGTTTTVNSNTVNIGDNIIVINADETGTPSQNGGIEIERGTSTNVSFLWDEVVDKWTVGSGTLVAGTFEGALSGNATTASTLATGRTISLTGAVTGSTTFDGSGNVSITTTAASDPTLTLAGDATGSATFTNLGNATLTVTVVDDSHNHIISNVDGLQTALDSKLNLSGGTLTGTIAFGAGVLDPDGYSSYSGGFGNIQDGSGWGARGVFVHGGGTGDAAAMAHNGGGLFFGIQDGTNANSMSTWLDVTPGRAISFSGTGLTYNSHTIWHAGNDGSGSGLDADLWDGNQFSSYLNQAVLTTSSPTFANAYIGTSSSVPGVKFEVSGTNGQLFSVVDSAGGTIFSVNDVSGIPSIEVDDDGTIRLAEFAGNVLIGTATDNGTDLLQVDGSASVADDGYITFGPNSTWSSYLRVGGNGRTVNGNTYASVATTNGNLHIDAGNAMSTYLNFYAGTGGIAFGNGASGVVAWMGPDGDLWKGGADNTGSKYWHAGNDGSGSGLDADLIDGIAFRNGNSTNATAPNNVTDNGTGYINSVSLFGQTDGALYSQAYSSSWVHQIFGDYRTGNMAVRGRNNGSWTSWGTVWTSLNDGSGSGLDADTVDGIQASSFLRSDTSDTMTGELNITYNGGATGSTAPNYSQANIELQTSSNYVPAISFHRGGYSAGVLYEYDGQIYSKAWVTRGQDGLLLSSGNIGSYAWTSSNDGSGSGLDADLWDGNQFSSYLNQAVLTTSSPTFSNTRVNSLGVNTAASGTAGEIRATNNITAYYSDERLKTFKDTIENAVQKVMSLNGYYFVGNQVAEKYGYNTKNVQVGVSAQEVERVLPEIVTAAPFDIGQNEDGSEYSLSGENYKTVYYDKLTPLLIEAIKEQQRHIEALNKKIDVLEAKLEN